MWIIPVIIIAVLVIILFVFGYFLARFVVHPNCHDLNSFLKDEDNKKYYEKYLKFNREKYIVNSFDNTAINCELIKNNDSKNYVIISHGYTVNRYHSIKYAEMFMKFGFNVIIYDDRGHGDNQRCTITMGIKESKDLIAVIDDTYKRYGEDIYLGLHGESMGSGLQILSLQYKPKIKFIVNDCGYANLSLVLKHKLHTDFHLPSFLLFFANVMCRICFKYSFNKVNPIEHINDIEVPILFVTGDSDNFIDKSHSERMKEAHKYYDEIYICPNADHACSYSVNTEEYQNRVKAFLKNINYKVDSE